MALSLAAYLDKPNTLTREELARRLGVTESAVYRWATGRRCPTLAYALQIERLTKGAVRAAGFLPKRAPRQPSR